MKECCALVARGVETPSCVESFLGCGDCAVDVLRVALGDLGQELAGGWIEYAGQGSSMR